MSETFEVFERPSDPQQEPLLTVHPSGRLVLNRAAYELIGRPRTVDLLFRRQMLGKMIGVRAAQPVGPVQPLREPYRVDILRDGGSAAVEAADFFDAYNLRPAEARSWPATLEGQILAADLDTEGQVAT